MGRHKLDLLTNLSEFWYHRKLITRERREQKREIIQREQELKLAWPLFVLRLMAYSSGLVDWAVKKILRGPGQANPLWAATIYTSSHSYLDGSWGLCTPKGDTTPPCMRLASAETKKDVPLRPPNSHCPWSGQGSSGNKASSNPLTQPSHRSSIEDQT